MQTIEQKPDAASGKDVAALDKLAFGQLFDVSKRTVDSWLAAGCPHLKLSARMVRIPLAEGVAWVKERFTTQRRAAA